MICVNVLMMVKMVGPTMPIRTIGYCYLDKGGQR
jgi:hypothetical protein